MRGAEEPVVARWKSWDDQPVFGPGSVEDGAAQVAGAIRHRGIEGRSSGPGKPVAVERDIVGGPAGYLEADDVSGAGGHPGWHEPIDVLLRLYLEPDDVDLLGGCRSGRAEPGNPQK